MKKAVIAGAAAAILGGCTVLNIPFPHACEAPVCHVTVTVQNCRYQVDPPELHVRRGNQNSQIHWTLRNSGSYEFTSDGIFFKTPTGGELHSPGNQGRVFIYHNRNSRPGRYDYGIKVQEGGRACPAHDPAVVNDM